MGFFAARDLPAAARSWRYIRVQGAVLPLLLAAAVAASFWAALPTELRIALSVMMALACLNHAHLCALARRRAGSGVAARAS